MKRIVAIALALLLLSLTPNLFAQRAALATATLTDGSITSVTVTDGGEGYSEAPIVTISGGDGSGATAVAIVGGGAVSQITVLTPGSGYTTAPEVFISAPPVQPALVALQMVPLVTITGLPGDTNEIQFCTTLTSNAVWIPLTNLVLSSSSLEWYDRISHPGTHGFYRAVLLGVGDRPMPGLRFVWLPAGRFVMGSPATELDRESNEGPQTRVTFTRGFYLGRYEVTQGEYLSVIGSNPSFFLGDTNRPVEMVSWDDATNYCAQLTAQERVAGRLPAGWAYRLPTEAEWEYAARAGSTNRLSYGNDPSYTQLANYAWYSANSEGTTHARGGRQPNRWGLYDMMGNVREWCWDLYGNYPGGDVTDPSGLVSGVLRVIRGGSLYSAASNSRSAYRNYYGFPVDKYSSLGFRVVLAPGQ